MSATLALAFGAGLLAIANPCGFALLPGFLSLYIGGSEQGEPLLARTAQGFVVGLVLSVSFGGVFVVAGLAVSAGLRPFLDLIPWLAALIGAGLVVLGLMMLAGRHVGLTPASRIHVGVGVGSTAGYRRVALFGATYAIASLSCTLGIFLVVIGQALATANPWDVVAVFVAYAAGSSSILIALALSAALAKGALARTVHRLLPAVNRISGALLTASGLYLILYWLPTLGGAAVPDSPLIRFSAEVSSSFATFFSARTALFAGGLGALLTIGIALLWLDARAPSSASEARLDERRGGGSGSAL